MNPFNTTFTRNMPNNYEKQTRSAYLMRQNIKELNRSMQSIEKMIEKSRRIISRSRESVLTQSLQKVKENQYHLTSPASKNKDFNHNESHRKSNKTKTFYKQIDFAKINLNTSNKPYKRNQPASVYQSNFKAQKNDLDQNSSAKAKQAILNQTIKARQRIQSKNKQPASPYKEIVDQGKTIYRFSPQKTNHLQFNLNKSLEKTHLVKTQKPKYKYLRPNQDQCNEEQALFQSKPTHHKENILIEDEENISELCTSIKQQKQLGKQYRFKTQCTQEDQGDIYNKYKLESPSFNSQSQPQKKKINLKLFDTQSKKSCLVSQRSKKSTFQSIKISARKNLVKELEQLQTHSSTEQERKAKFILKIKKYGFVEKHLTQEQIWSIYDQLVKSDIPQLKWPIVIVDQVYQKMKSNK